MKKMIAIISVSVLLFTVLPMTALAAHGNHHGNAQAAKYSICTTASCTETGLHTHGRKAYLAHYYGDGHDYHVYCSIENCSLNGYHSHDGTYCFGHTANDGHDYHDYCGIADCNLTGYHEHNGAYCFGHTDNDGHNNHNLRRSHH